MTDPLPSAIRPGLDFARSVSDPTRQSIMEHCCCRWCSVGDLVVALDGRVTQPTVSHHLAVLREAGLVRSRREGRQVFYTLDQAEVARCCRWLVSTFAPESQAALQLRQDITLYETGAPSAPSETAISSGPKSNAASREPNAAGPVPVAPEIVGMSPFFRWIHRCPSMYLHGQRSQFMSVDTPSSCCAPMELKIAVTIACGSGTKPGVEISSGSGGCCCPPGCCDDPGCCSPASATAE